MRDTSSVGNQTEAMVVAALLQMGKKVLLPFGSGHNYDLVFEDDSGFSRVQCKTARYSDGCLLAKAYRVPNRDIKQFVRYTGIDFFALYAPHNGKVYLVPVSDVPGFEVRLRLDLPKNGRLAGVKWAVDYECGYSSSGQSVMLTS